jgi:uncharacterized protein
MGTVDLVLKPFEISLENGNLLRGDLRYPAGSLPHPLIIVCHSFMAFKDWGFFPHVGEMLAGAGFASFVFDFSMNGASSVAGRITDFGKFEQNTFAQELVDIRSVVDAVAGGRIGEGAVNPDSIGLLGHSRGGGLAILHASRDMRIRSLVTWAAIASFDRWTRRQKEMWRQTGTLPLARNSGVSPLRLGIGLLDDLEAHRAEYDLRLAAKRIAIPWLILHGGTDVTVPVREAEQLYTASDPEMARLEILEHTGHLFNAASSEEDGWKTIDRVIDRTVRWFHSTL